MSDRDECESTEQRNAFNPIFKLSLQIDEITEEFNQRFVELLDMVKERPAGYVQYSDVYYNLQGAKLGLLLIDTQ